MRPAPAALLRLREAVSDARVRLALDIAVARIEGEDAGPYVERLTALDPSFREHREIWGDASADQVERSAIDLVLEGAISGGLRRIHH
jgi:hypothetical protein